MKNKGKNKLAFLTSMNLKKKVRSKWFLVINLIMLIIVPCICNVDTIIKSFGGDFDETTIIYVEDNVNVYDKLKINYENAAKVMDITNVEFKKNDKDLEELKTSLKDDESKNLILVIESDKANTIKAKLISYDYVDTIMYQSLFSAINTTKQELALINSNIDPEELATIYQNVEVEREFLTEDLDENNELMEFIGGILTPVLVVPVFFLIIMIVNFIGAEINEEKTSKSMEIIISSVSPIQHFLSKILSTNLFVLIQSGLLLLFGGVGILSRKFISGTSILDALNIDVNTYVSTFVDSGLLHGILISVPVIIIMFILTFLAYSFLAGILASMTTSMEDYQQLQTPLMILLLIGYYLGIMASLYDSSLFIKIVSYIPFISGILSPVLLIIGQATLLDVTISTILLILTNYLLIKYGIRIYRVGILNYSSSKLWKKMANAIKEK